MFIIVFEMYRRHYTAVSAVTQCATHRNHFDQFESLHVSIGTVPSKWPFWQFDIIN